MSRCSTNWRNHARKRGRQTFRIAAALLSGFGAILLLAAASLGAQDRLAVALMQFQHETDPVHKARELAKLSSMQISEAQDQLKSGDDVGSLNTLQAYLQEVQQAYGSLADAGINAEKKPSGYKELQISVRESMRRVDDLILTLPVDKRPFFRQVRAGLLMVQNQLIDALFPRRPAQNGNKAGP